MQSITQKVLKVSIPNLEYLLITARCSYKARDITLKLYIWSYAPFYLKVLSRMMASERQAFVPLAVLFFFFYQYHDVSLDLIFVPFILICFRSMFFCQLTYRFPILLDAATAAVQRKGDKMLLKWADIMTGKLRNHITSCILICQEYQNYVLYSVYHPYFGLFFHEFRKTSMQPDQLPSSHLDIPKMIMDSSKSGRWIIPFKKFSRLRVN